ncbi:hypothetical protein R1sor_016148 [Riccia sorocarpa]|uniref:FAD-dependent oxidoreductase domain-containing protein 1 n=1 Tax=Riccia sorocarpa TaxID=122646 RepID=A0ABD3HKC9_9MARC
MECVMNSTIAAVNQGFGSRANKAFSVERSLFHPAPPVFNGREIRIPCKELRGIARVLVPKLQRRGITSRRTRRRSTRASIAAALEYDVVIVGAGVVGTATAHHILTTTTLSVALIDAKLPCSGATGAGQGYIWMAHRKPGTAGWALAKHGKSLWETFAQELQENGENVLTSLGLRHTGSLLVASTDDQTRSLRNWIQDLLQAGIPSTYWTPEEVVHKEPSLASGCVAGAAYFHEDFQIDAALTMDALLKKVREYEAGGRYKELFYSPVQQLLRSPAEGRIVGVEIPAGKVFSRSAVVIATGAWSSGLMNNVSSQWGIPLVPLVKPRKGHLLVIEGPHNIQLTSGIMEVDYLANYYKTRSQGREGAKPTEQSGVSVSMTATLDPNGNLLLGSSREFAGFNVDVEDEVIERMVERAARFLPGVKNMKGKARIGLRPYSSDGRPLIGPVEDVPGLILATGHEGSGLCLALATAELVANMIQEVENPAEFLSFLPCGRLVSALA